MTGSIIQGSDEWKAARVGSLGASCVHEVIAKTKTGYSSSRANRFSALVLERLTGRPVEIFETAAMRQGKEREPDARIAYAWRSDDPVVECGIYKHPKLVGTHASPDGLVGAVGLVEIKCPQPTEHLETLRLQRIPEKYVTQMMWQMACTGRDWCDYVSFNPDFPPAMQLWIKRVPRDDKRIGEIEQEVAAFIIELESTIAALNKKYEQKEAA